MRQSWIKRFGYRAMTVALMVGWGLLTGWTQEQSPTQSPETTKQEKLSQGQEKAAPSTPTKSRRKRIAVVDLEVPMELVQTFIPAKKGKGEGADQEAILVQVRAASNRLSTIVSDMLISALVQTGVFDVIERTQLQRLLEEHQLAKEGLLDPSTAAKAGKILGVDFILGGKLTEFGIKEKREGGAAVIGLLTGGAIDIRKSTARAVVDARLVDTSTGRILMAVQGTGENKEQGVLFGGGSFTDFIAGARFDTQEWTDSRIGKATRTAVEQVIQKILEMFPLEATVLFVLPDDSVILDLGKFSGIKEGDMFEIYRETEMKDEQTGEVIWRERKKIGTVKVVEVQEERCKCAPVSTVEKPQKGDIAVLKKPEPPKEEPKKGKK